MTGNDGGAVADGIVVADDECDEAAAIPAHKVSAPFADMVRPRASLTQLFKATVLETVCVMLDNVEDGGVVSHEVDVGLGVGPRIDLGGFSML